MPHRRLQCFQCGPSIWPAVSKAILGHAVGYLLWHVCLRYESDGLQLGNVCITLERKPAEDEQNPAVVFTYELN